MTQRYIPALRFRVLTGAYDPLMALALRERRWKRALVEQLGLRPGMRVLDLGCGTGTLTVMLAQAGAAVTALDGDLDALARARRKADERGLEVAFVEALAENPPLPPASFDRVVSSLLFHHLTTASKQRALAAARELLTATGELHVADWGRPDDPLTRAGFLLVRLLDGFDTTADSAAGRLPALIRETGFTQVAETGRWRSVTGVLSLLTARP